MHLHLDHKVNQLIVEGQGPHILDDSEATYKDILMLLPAPILQQLHGRIKSYQDSIQCATSINFLFELNFRMLNYKMLLAKLSIIGNEAWRRMDNF